VTAAVQSRSKTVYTPPLVNVLTAVPGGTISSTATWVTTTTLNGVDQWPVSFSSSTTGVFVGVESVTIAAGTFNACRFEQRDAGAQGPLTTRWVLLGHGVELKSSTPAGGGSGAYEAELSAILVNVAVPN